MLALERTVAVLLCAGLSRRFGAGDKLLAPLRGRPLVRHAAELLASLPLLDRIAITCARAGPLHEMLDALGFTLVANERPEAGHDISIRLGIESALGRGADAVLICLGDMPNVSRGHVAALAELADEDTVAMSTTSAWSSPPTMIPAAVARRILEEAHQPAKQILTGGKIAYAWASAAILADFDTPADFRSSRTPSD